MNCPKCKKRPYQACEGTARYCPKCDIPWCTCKSIRCFKDRMKLVDFYLQAEGTKVIKHKGSQSQ